MEAASLACTLVPAPCLGQRWGGVVIPSRRNRMKDAMGGGGGLGGSGRMWEGSKVAGTLWTRGWSWQGPDLIGYCRS